MSRLLFIILAITTGSQPIYGEAENPVEPEKLTSLREAWTQAKERDYRPIRDQYLNALINLRKKLTQQNNLRDAVLVRDEIEVLTQRAKPKENGKDAARMPAQLTSLRDAYGREMARVASANDKTYTAALKKMQQHFAKNGELEAALAVQAEMVRATRSRIVAPIPEEAKEWNGHFYLIYDEKVNWKEAVAGCEKLAGHLVTITSKEESEFVLLLAGKENCWIGATDEKKEGQWRWVTDEPFTFKHWWPGEPDNAVSQEHYAVCRVRSSGGAWGDIHGSFKCRFMCEWEPEIP